MTPVIAAGTRSCQADSGTADMPRDQRLKMLSQAFDRISPPPRGRSVLMVARIVTKTPIGGVAREFPAQDPGARVPGGRVHAILINDPNFLEIATWNTGQPSDLRKTGNRSHAENQFYEFMRDKEFSKVEIEISHSPCTLLRLVGRTPKRQEGSSRLAMGATL
jgi:hypothetical protein